MKISCITDKGLVRPNNEDSLLAIPPWSNDAITKKACLFVVADGMGGQNAGEVASKLAINQAQIWFKENNSENLTTKDMEELISSVNEQVWDYSQKHPETKGMGTTFSAIMIKNTNAIIGHIGDSRIYRLRNDNLTQLTHDHSIVGEQVRLGKLTPNQARIHPARGILSKVLGPRQFVTPDIFETDLQANDEIVLCTDGIYTMMDCELLEQLIKNTSVEKLSKVLIDSANKAGGKDNSTVIAFKINDFPIKIPSRYSLSRLIELFMHHYHK